MEERKSLVNYSPIGRNVTEGLGSGDQRPYWFGETRETISMKTGFNFTSKVLSIEMASVFLFSSNNMGAMMWKGSAESFGIKRQNNTLYFLSLICFLYSVPVNSKKNLTIGAYVPLTGSCWRGGFVVKTVIEWALEQVNERHDVLFGYQLNVVLNDTKVCKMDFENGLENELFMAQFVRVRIKS